MYILATGPGDKSGKKGLSYQNKFASSSSIGTYCASMKRKQSLAHIKPLSARHNGRDDNAFPAEPPFCSNMLLILSCIINRDQPPPPTPT